MTSPTRSDSSTSSLQDPALDATIQAVNWDSILRTVRDKVGATTARWGQQKSGGYNVIRFLHLDDDQVVVRLPLYPHPELSGPMSPKIMDRNVRKTATMLASMEYVATHTSIPVPRIIHSCLDPELGDVRSPYVVLSKMEGTSLSKFWDDMPDTQRDIVLGQVVDILLELSTLRFDKIGSLFKTRDGDWCIEAPTEEGDIPEATYRSGTDQYLAIRQRTSPQITARSVWQHCQRD
ncbi:hypothetical protein J3R83DRAFT_7308 [Lanmaoa asiatica]|nr:hypothetical protein J3R83DRAFT_7308 [Lanmaoa asiatica]